MTIIINDLHIFIVQATGVDFMNILCKHIAVTKQTNEFRFRFRLGWFSIINNLIII
jgi:hypothetical protein